MTYPPFVEPQYTVRPVPRAAPPKPKPRFVPVELPAPDAIGVNLHEAIPEVRLAAPDELGIRLE